MPWITRVGSALRQARLVCGKKGEDAGDVKIPSGPMEDITIALTQTNGKPAGELLVGMKFSHTPGAPPSAKNSYTNEASTWRMLWVVGCGLWVVRLCGWLYDWLCDWLYDWLYGLYN